MHQGFRPVFVDGLHGIESSVAFCDHVSHVVVGLILLGNNHFVHYGKAGLDMFGQGYAAVIDSDGKPLSAFEFDDLAASQSHTSMLNEIPQLLDKNRDGVLFGNFFAQRCNTTPATREMIEKAALELVKENEIEMVGESNLAHTRLIRDMGSLLSG